jgi:hypothetical protein
VLNGLLCSNEGFKGFAKLVKFSGLALSSADEIEDIVSQLRFCRVPALLTPTRRVRSRRVLHALL